MQNLMNSNAELSTKLAAVEFKLICSRSEVSSYSDRALKAEAKLAALENGLFSHKAATEFWRVWNEVGEPHKHGLYESTWMGFRAALECNGKIELAAISENKHLLEKLAMWQERAWKAENEVTELTQTNVKLVAEWAKSEAKLAAVEEERNAFEGSFNAATKQLAAANEEIVCLTTSMPLNERLLNQRTSLNKLQAKLAKVEPLPARWKTYGHTSDHVAKAYEILTNELEEALE
jgi:hypothetical protein